MAAMSNRLTRLFVLTGLLGFPLFVSGCFEEKDSVTVYADGSGKIHLHRKFNKDTTEMMTSTGDKNNMQATLDGTLYKDLGPWEGIAAWADCRAAMDGDCLVTEATGYFRDIAKLKRLEGTETQSFRWAGDKDGGFTLTWSSANSNEKEPFEEPAPTAEQKQMADNMLQMLKGLRVEREMILPGPANAWTGCNTHQGRSASLVYTDNDAFKLSALQDDYQKKVDQGVLTKGKARDAFKVESQRLAPQNISVTCGPGSVADEFTQFQKDFARAREEYASADTAQKIKAAKAKQP
jgi:hypothetical protein